MSSKLVQCFFHIDYYPNSYLKAKSNLGPFHGAGHWHPSSICGILWPWTLFEMMKPNPTIHHSHYFSPNTPTPPFQIFPLVPQVVFIFPTLSLTPLLSLKLQDSLLSTCNNVIHFTKILSLHFLKATAFCWVAQGFNHSNVYDLKDIIDLC